MTDTDPTARVVQARAVADGQTTGTRTGRLFHDLSNVVEADDPYDYDRRRHDDVYGEHVPDVER